MVLDKLCVLRTLTRNPYPWIYHSSPNSFLLDVGLDLNLESRLASLGHCLIFTCHP